MKSLDHNNNCTNFMTYNGNHLFHYTSFLFALKILSSRTLLFGDFKSMNDIAESRRDVLNDIAISELNKYKSISFTADKRLKRGFEIDSLWGHYAEKGNGICLVFNKLELISYFKTMKCFKRYGSISYIRDYSNAIINISEADETVKSIEKKYRDIFFTKSMDWKNENEYRLLIRTEDNSQALNFHDSLMAIITCMPLVEDLERTPEYLILKEISNVPILRYQTNLGNKTLQTPQGEYLWPLLGVDYQLDVN